MTLGQNPSMGSPSTDEPAQDAGFTAETDFRPELSTANSRTYQREDGLLQTESYGTVVNYPTDSGWAPIENELVPSNEGDAYAVENSANGYTAAIPEDLSTTPVKFTVDDAWVSMKLRRVPTAEAPAVTAAKAVFDAGAVADEVIYEATNTGLKETIVLEQPPATSVTFRYDIEVSPGLTPHLNDGAVEFEGPSGAVHVTIPRGTMTDSAAPVASSEDIDYSLASTDDGSWTLTVTPDPQWLSDPARSYPVLVDPSLVNSAAVVRDCTIRADDPNLTRCGTGTAYNRVGRYDADRRFRSVLRFDVSAIPTDAIVTASRVYLYMDASMTSGTAAAEYTVSRTSKPFDNSATWSSAGAAGSWTGGSPTGDPTPSRLIDGSNGGFKNWNVKHIVEGWLDGTFARDGLVLIQSTPANNMLHFHSSSTTSDARLPYIETTYDMPFDEEATATDFEGVEPGEEIAVTASWTAMLDCMKSTNQVGQDATVEQIFGSINDSQEMLPPSLGTSAPSPSEECVLGAGSLIGGLTATAEGNDLSQDLAEVESDLESGAISVEPQAPAPGFTDTEVIDPKDPTSLAYVSAPDGGSSDCRPGVNSFMSGLNHYSDISMSDFGWYSPREIPCRFRWDDDICSISPNRSYTYDFTWPCKRHDFMYRNLQRAEAWYNRDIWRRYNKNVADEQFQRDMRAHCAGRSVLIRPDCYLTAKVYYLFASRHGANTLSYSTPWTFQK